MVRKCFSGKRPFCGHYDSFGFGCCNYALPGKTRCWSHRDSEPTPGGDAQESDGEVDCGSGEGNEGDE